MSKAPTPEEIQIAARLKNPMKVVYANQKRYESRLGIRLTFSAANLKDAAVEMKVLQERIADLVKGNQIIKFTGGKIKELPF